jgi:hypothetical protein
MSDENDQRVPGRASFRLQLAEAARQPEFTRADSMIWFLRQIRRNPYFTQDECFTAVYGADGARAFWGVLCSEPIELRRFVNVLTVTGAPLKAAESNLLAAMFAVAGGATLEEAAYIVNLFAAMLDAYQAGERTWFVGDVTPLEGATNGWQVLQAKGQDRLEVRARDAAAWLWRTPKHCHLVPDWLAAVLRPAQPVLGKEVTAVRPTQSDVNAWMQLYYQQARANGKPPPKRVDEAFRECADRHGATDAQMRAAMRTVPSDLKRTRGGRDRKSGGKSGD